MATLAWLTAWLLSATVANTVVVHVAPDDAAAAQAIAASCSEALGQAQCVLHEPALDPGDAEQPPVHARVALSEDALQAVIELDGNGPSLDTRTLTFTATDPLQERHRAIGLVIAARVLEREKLAQAERERLAREEALQAERAREAAARPLEIEPASIDLDLAGFVGPGLTEGPARFGGMLRASVRPVASVPLAALLALRMAARSGEPRVIWTAIGLGLAGHIDLGPAPPAPGFALELRAEALAQRIDVHVSESGVSESGYKLRYGGALGLELSYRLGRTVALFAGGESSLLWKRFVLEVNDRVVNAEGASGFAALAGMRVSL